MGSKNQSGILVMKTVKITLSYSWDINEKEWEELQEWDEETTKKMVKSRLEYDAVSSFYSLSQIKVPSPIDVKVELL